MALVQARANEILDYMHALGAPPTVTSPIRLRLMTSTPTSTAAGTELVNSGGYTGGASAGSVTFGAASTGSAASTTAYTVTNMPATTITHVELWDSTGSPKRMEFGALASSKTTNSGDTFSIAIGAITSALA